MVVPLPKSQRVELSAEQFGLAEIALWGIDRQTFAEEGLAEHDHEGCLEIHYLRHGEQHFCVDGTTYRMSPGDLFVTSPFERHSSGGYPHGRCELYWMQITLTPLRPGFLGLERKAARMLARQLCALPRRQFAGSRLVRTLFEDIFLMAQKEIPHKSLSLSCRIVQWLLEVIACSRIPPAGSPTPDIQRVLDHVRRHLADPISLDALADVAGLSLSHFKTKFKNQVGLAPGEYAMVQKIKRAEELLQAGTKSITQIAFDLGFSSSQYFATVFKRFTSKQPRAFHNRRV